MKALSPRLRALSAAVAARPRVLLLLDYDGTLVPIRARPQLARLAPGVRATLARLHGRRLRLIVVSGRSIKSLKACVGLPRLGYCGVFGLAAVLPGWNFLHPRARALRPAIAGLVRKLRGLFEDFPGVMIEDKGAGAAVHYRLTPRARRAELSRGLARARARSPRAFVWKRSDYALEIVPRTRWNKGRAADLLWRRHARPYLLAIGNDRFDEPMLRAAEKHGAGIRVGKGPSKARYRLKDTREVHRFLRALAAPQASKR